MTDPNFTSQEAGLNFNTVVESIIKRSCIIDFGIVQEVVSDGIVDVSVAVAKTEQDMFCMTCVLANIASKAFTLNVKPQKGDRVLVVYPRLYDDNMFNFTGSEEDDTKLKVNYKAKGYNLTSGIAILLNQYKESGYKNFITVDEGNISAELNKVKLTTTKDGDITVNNGKATAGIDKDGAITTGNEKATINIDKDGAVTVDNGKATINVDKNGNVSVDAQGKYTIKNSSTDLFSVISDLNGILKGLKTAGSETAQTIDPSTVTLLTTWENSELKALLNAPAPVTP